MSGFLAKQKPDGALIHRFFLLSADANLFLFKTNTPSTLRAITHLPITSCTSLHDTTTTSWVLQVSGHGLSPDGTTIITRTWRLFHTEESVIREWVDAIHVALESRDTIEEGEFGIPSASSSSPPFFLSGDKVVRSGSVSSTGSCASLVSEREMCTSPVSAVVSAGSSELGMRDLEGCRKVSVDSVPSLSGYRGPLLERRVRSTREVEEREARMKKMREEYLVKHEKARLERGLSMKRDAGAKTSAAASLVTIVSPPSSSAQTKSRKLPVALFLQI
ncbi:hypothetical protein HDU98_012361 [Podochytrium sp. JEL0797]|nr:hypothetical protein HDU98_012361 [Podochytrium sp. JEL0797]